MKKFDMKIFLRIFRKTKIEKVTLKEFDKAQARADDDGFALPKKKENVRTP